jgi:tetratricopeptide (TPR) repeat protein
MRTLAISLLLCMAVVTRADDPKPPALTPEEKKLGAEAVKLSRAAFQLYEKGQAAEAVEKLQQALENFRKIYPTSRYPNGHPHIAGNLNNLGILLQSMGQTQKSFKYYQQSLEMTRKLFPAATYPDGHPQIADILNNLGVQLQSMDQAEKAHDYFRQSLEMYRKLFPASKYPDGHPDLAKGLSSMGSVLKSMGQAKMAFDHYRESLEMRQKLYPAANYPEGHPRLAGDLNGIGLALEMMGQAEKASHYFRQNLEMNRKLYPADRFPQGHSAIAGSLSNMGNVLEAMGQADRAFEYYREGLEMMRSLFPVSRFPHGHPDLAGGLSNLGFVMESMGELSKAFDYYRQGLEMRQNLYPPTKYPDGHPELAHSLNSLGSVLVAMGQAERAVDFFQQSLQLNQKLYPVSKYPDGNRHLGANLGNLGIAMEALGQTEKALGYFRQSLEMYRRQFPASKYPDGHPDLAVGLNSMGEVLRIMNRRDEAIDHLLQGLSMQQRLLRRELATASEEAAFDKVKSQPLFRDHFLSATRSTQTTDRDVFIAIWPSRAMVTRLLEQRQASARAAGTELGDKLDRLRGLRRRLDSLLQDSKMMPEDRDKLLASIADDRDRLEREVVAAMPTLQRWAELDKLGPVDLAKALPAEAVFVDVIRYTRFEYVEKKEKRTPSYVAFVVATTLTGAAGSQIHRVELGDAKPIDDAVAAWRHAIESRGNESAALELSQRVWGPLAKAIPAGTTTLYIAADGDLARLPWAALPISNDQVLLEKYALAEVPHGTWLLDQLQTKASLAREGGESSLLTLGGVDYGMSIWPALPGTVTETKAITAIAPGYHQMLSGKDATAEKLKSLLSQARFVHFATHGEFKADALSAERQRAAKALESRLLGAESRKVAAKNPLGYVGLVLSNGEVMSGLGIQDLPLAQSRLVTLSACETGLGALTSGEGVQGLQRAFHLAGCPNVVASLWKVNDTATAALMAKFYHEMWVNKKPPIEALREAQLTIYRRPDLIPDLAGERGAPRLKEAAALKLSPRLAGGSGEPPVSRRLTADTKLWAAFVLSGVGK